MHTFWQSYWQTIFAAFVGGFAGSALTEYRLRKERSIKE